MLTTSKCRDCFAAKMQLSPEDREGAAWLSYLQTAFCPFPGGYDQLLAGDRRNKSFCNISTLMLTASRSRDGHSEETRRCVYLKLIFSLSLLFGHWSPFAFLGRRQTLDRGNAMKQGWSSPMCLRISCSPVILQPLIWEITFISAQVTFKPCLGRDTSSASWTNVQDKDKSHTFGVFWVAYPELSPQFSRKNTVAWFSWASSVNRGAE